VVDGEAAVEMADGASIALVSGDIVIFLHGDPHHMSSGRGARPPFPNHGITPKILARDLTPLRAGGGGPVSKFACGYMTCDPHPPDAQRTAAVERFSRYLSEPPMAYLTRWRLHLAAESPPSAAPRAGA
jgi:hypothetical protein